MIGTIDASLIDWSRGQFAMTAIYHWIFVPLTLGLALIMGIMETQYYRTGDEFWKRTAKFWMKLFGINFAVGVATGLILEFEFGTNWSNYSHVVGDIFGAPLAIEGIVAFFMEATFIAVMFFGWEKVSKRFHLASTWLTGLGATISAWWILVANAWMQHPVGMAFNPDTVRFEMVEGSFSAVAFSPVAISKFCHTVLSGWVLGAIFVVGISCWYLLKKREQKFALSSIKVAACVGLIASLLSAFTGDSEGHVVAQSQPMKLAAMEGLYEGETQAGLVAVGLLNPAKEAYNDSIDPFLFKVKVPWLLSFLAARDVDAYVPGITNLIDGGYPLADGTPALSADEKMKRGKMAIDALADYGTAKKNHDAAAAQAAKATLQENMPYFGYGYIKEVDQLIPNVPLTFYAFRIMVVLGCYFIVFFLVVLFLAYKRNLAAMNWMHRIALLTIFFGYVAVQTGWIVAECGRQPWAIQDMLPVNAAISRLNTGSVQLTFFLFLILFAILLIAEINILLKAIRKGPEMHIVNPK
ncbi:MAG: cytochrome ubiquinol oxidase subunit I [Prevotellaceae bacterium]|jgi:cytochrome d ubiquinol oxidase subunit I|nr:cytochrome ubiquinol oxidase subunit I [Prevotellaceae bacterium]